jgi:hypothetical protein
MMQVYTMALTTVLSRFNRFSSGSAAETVETVIWPFFRRETVGLRRAP